jgi:hypothetical protein
MTMLFWPWCETCSNLTFVVDMKLWNVSGVIGIILLAHEICTEMQKLIIMTRAPDASVAQQPPAIVEINKIDVSSATVLYIS